MKKRHILCPVLALFIWWNLPAPAADSPSMSLNYGFHLFAGPFDIRAYQKTKTVSFEKIPDISDFKDFTSLFQKPVWSISADSSRKAKTPVSVKFQIGDLSYSGAVSRLKTLPLSTSFSYFSNAPSLSKDLGISQPSSSSSTKTKSAAVLIKTQNSKIAFSCDFDGFIKSSASFTARPGDFFTISMLACYADFTFSQKNETSWRLSEPQFISDRKHACYFETLFSIPLVKLKIGTNAIENPYNTVRFNALADLLFHYGIFSLNLSGFASDSALMEFKSPSYSISQTKNSVLYQAKINPTFDFSVNKIHFKTGISALYVSSIPEDSVKNEKLHFAAGFSAVSNSNRFSFQYKMQNLDVYYFSPKYASLTFSEEEKLKHSISVRYTHIFKPLSITLTARADAEPKRFIENSTYSQSISLSVNFRSFIIRAAVLGAKFEEKNSTLKSTFNGSLSAEYSTKILKITAKIGVTGPLVVE